MNTIDYHLTTDGFGIHTFELVRSILSKEEYKRLKSIFYSDKPHVYHEKGNIKYTPNSGIRFHLCKTNDNRNLRIIVTPLSLITGHNSPTEIFTADKIELLSEVLENSITNIIGDDYTLDKLTLTRIDCCVNVLLSSDNAAALYVKMLRKSYAPYHHSTNNKHIVPQKIHKHCFKVETTDVDFTAYDKYNQLDSINADYTKEADSLLRIELICKSGHMRKHIHQNEIHQKNYIFDIITYYTKESKNFIVSYLENNYKPGDYYTYSDICKILDDSTINKKAKIYMEIFCSLQQYQKKYTSAIRCFDDKYCYKKTKKVLDGFENLDINPTCLPVRDKCNIDYLPGIIKLIQGE